MSNKFFNNIKKNFGFNYFDTAHGYLGEKVKSHFVNVS